MKKRVLWALLALGLLLILILVIAQPRSDSNEKTAESGEASSDAAESSAPEKPEEPEPEKESGPALAEGELPLDVTQPKPANETTGDQSSTPAPQQAEASPNVDPGTGMELEDDELPLDIP